MKIENTFPYHTTEEEWNELAVLASKILSSLSVSLQQQNTYRTMTV